MHRQFQGELRVAVYFEYLKKVFLIQFQMLVPSQMLKIVFMWHSEMCFCCMLWPNFAMGQLRTNRAVFGAKRLKIVYVPHDAIDDITTCWRPDGRNRDMISRAHDGNKPMR